MKITSFTVAVLVVAFAGNTAFSQRKQIKRISAVRSIPAKRQPSYELNLKLAAGGKMFLSVTSGPEGELGPSDLGALITDLPTGADKFNTPNNVFPKVEISADPELTMLEVWNPITLFRQGRSDIHLSVPNGLSNGGHIEIAVPWDLPEPDVNVKPNPLFLVVTVADDGKLSLNNESTGTVSNTELLSDRLRNLFKEREANGVFREGTNEVEKSVMIAMPMSSRKFSDLISIARAIWLPGGDRIFLLMGDPLAIPDASLALPDDRKSLLDVPPVLPKRKRKP